VVIMDGDRKELSIACGPSGRNGTAALTVRLGDDVLAAENVNLLEPKKRGEFANRLCDGRPGVDPKAVEAELLKLAADLAKRPGRPEADPSGRPDPATLLATMPEAVRAEASAMLEAPDLMQRIVADIGLLGVAGEKELAATIYLVGVSRLLELPLASIVQGPTSTGKSYVIKKVASLFPAEAVVIATQLTPQALFYMKPGSLVHRFVVVGERSRAQDDETADATRALREMLSEGRLSKAIPVKMGDRLETKMIEQDGPIAYVESTTLVRVFSEDANRCILLATDERPEQTRRIIKSLAASYAKGPGADPAAVLNRHRALQRMLQTFPVAVPYAERLGEAIDEHRCEARRAFPQIVSLIQASALLHQRQRKVDRAGCLLADPDDYNLARHLLAVPIARQLGGRVSDGAVRFLDRLRAWFSAGDEFTTADAKKHETQSKSSVYGWVNELHDAGLLEKVAEHRGNSPAKYRLTAESADPDAAAVLPPVEKVCE